MPDEVIADRYELEELVGTGGMSSVYKARDRLLERNVALKVLHPHYGDDPEYVERFRREARAVAQLSHPHIVTVIDRGEDGGQQFIVFEYIDGENLKQLIERDGRLPVRRAIELVRDAATKEPAPALASRITEEAAKRGLLLLKAGVFSNCIRVLCPLVITDPELDEALGAWEEALEAVLA